LDRCNAREKKSGKKSHADCRVISCEAQQSISQR
jgi:hypothetical protein